jgi:hypothetical protein
MTSAGFDRDIMPADKCFIRLAAENSPDIEVEKCMVVKKMLIR